MRKKLSEIQPGERFWTGDCRTIVRAMVGPCKGGFAVQCLASEVVFVYRDPNDEYEIIPPTPEPKYRPFKDAAEFKPHRDRWVRWKGSPEEAYCFRVISYHQSVVGFASISAGERWDEAFLEIVFDDDGSPFGVLDTPNE